MEFYILENFSISVSHPDLDDWIRIQIQEGKNDPQKSNKVEKFHALKCWMFSRATDFSCCLDPDSGFNESGSETLFSIAKYLG
jgi:hypothetical protein